MSRYAGILEAANRSYSDRLFRLMEAEVINIKPILKAKKKKEKQEKEKLDFEKVRFGFSTVGYGDETAFVVSLPVVKSRVKKDMRSIVHDVHSYIGDRFGKYLGRPSVGGMSDRAKAGLVTLKFSYDVDPMDAYGLGYDLYDKRAGDISKSKQEVNRRIKDGEKMKDDLLGFKLKARDEMDKLRVPKDERDKMWKENYMEKYKNLARKYEKKGFTVIPFTRRARVFG